MRKPKKLTVALLSMAFALVAGASLAGSEGANVDELRFGTTVNAEGIVMAESASDHFNEKTPIHVTMNVLDAPKGTELVLTILNRDTEEVVWSKVRPVPGHQVNMHFVVNNLPTGKYRAKVKVGPDYVAEHEFRVGDVS